MRSSRRLTCLVVMLLTLGVNAFAQSFTVTDFRDTSGFVYVNVPTTSAVLDLTPGGALRPTVGAIWRRERVPIGGSWTSTIRFQITDTGGAADPSGRNGADGLAFVVQLESPEAIGSTGYGLGYHGIRGGLAVEVDTWDDSAEPIWNGATEDRADHVALMTNGRAALSSVPMFSAVTLSRVVGDVSDGAVHTLAVRATPGMIRVYLDDCTVPLIVWPVAVDTLLAPTAFIGITAATQSAWQRHKVVSWCFSTAGLCGCPVPCDVDTVTVRDTVTLRDTVVVRDTITRTRIDTVYILKPDSVFVRDTLQFRDTVIQERTRIDTLRVDVYLHDTVRVVIVDTSYVERTTVDTLERHDTTYVIRDTCAGYLPDSSVCGYVTRAFTFQDSTGISVHPNPASDAVAFDISAPGDWSLELYTARGQLVCRHRGSGSVETSHSVAEFQPGVYFAVLVCGDERRVREVRVTR